MEDKEIVRKENELHATIKLPAEAEAYKVNQIADGKRLVIISPTGAAFPEITKA